MPKSRKKSVWLKKRNYSTHWVEHSYRRQNGMRVCVFGKRKIGLGLAQTNNNIKWIIFRHIKCYGIDAQKKYIRTFPLPSLPLDLLFVDSAYFIVLWPEKKTNSIQWPSNISYRNIEIFFLAVVVVRLSLIMQLETIAMSV